MQPAMNALSALIAAVCGAAIGTLFTVAHRAVAPFLGIEVPYGIVLGLASVIAFLVAMRLLWETRWPAVGGALGVIGAVAVLTFAGAGGSVVVAADGFGWTWLVAAPLAAAVVVAWPRRRVRSSPEGTEADDTMDGPGTLGHEPAEER
ncbi:MAG: histidinol dehydrogenase [Microbacteriaceae bacterium]|nr:histidinol dehydrogenase [Microbacteriaceae bacterium]